MIPPISNEDIDWAEQRLGGDISFDGEGREFIRNLESASLVACPGSGKTTALIAKLLIFSRNLPLAGNRGVCILTHTNVAVEQIRTRVGALGQGLFSYPNFCGTFQAFVGRFLGHPAYVEHFGHRPVCVDNEVTARELLNRASRPWKKAMYSLEQRRISVENLRFNPQLQVTKKGKASPFMGQTTDTYRIVEAAKAEVLERGYLFFDDAFVFAERHLAHHPGLVGVFRKRFPFVFVDEMQDTDERQLEILNSLFSAGESVLQQVGDPNQAIYHQSAVGKGCLWEPPDGSPQLTTSRRFAPSVAAVVSNLAAVCPMSVTGVANTGDIKPHLVVFSDSRIGEVLPAFGKLIADHGLHQLNEKRGFKAVGCVAKAHESKHTLPSYWPSFEARRSRRQPSYVTLRGNLSSANVPEEFGSPRSFRRALLAGIVGLLEVGGVKTSTGRRFTTDSILSHLREHEEGASIALMKQCAEWCLKWRSGDELGEEVSAFLSEWLPALFDVDVEDADVKEYLTADEEAAPVGVDAGMSNDYSFDGGIINVSSVHGVKGETHTATLLLETFYYDYDIHRILPFLKGQPVAGQEPTRVKESLKVAFVACSRPTHLLAVAIHADTKGNRDADRQVTDEDLDALGRLWEIVDLR